MIAPGSCIVRTASIERYPMPSAISANTEVLLRVVFAANILVAGVVGVLTLFAPAAASAAVFAGSDTIGPAARVTGAFWTAIAVISVLGLVYPLALSPVLLIQLVYKGLWLLVVALPLLLSEQRRPMPWGMAGFFLVWVVVLPWVIPWRAMVSR